MANDSSDDDDEHVIIVGIDFGTTFSGASFAHSREPEEIQVISRWESKLNLNSDKEKAPSAILFPGKRGTVSWGYGIPPNAKQEPMRWFKLLLVDEKDLPNKVKDSPQIAAARKMVEEENKDPVEVISAYLTRFWDHAVECIITSHGQDFVDMCRLQVVITLPAIWPDYAKARMRRAVEGAGILKERPAGETTLSFISEPEAAALATVRDLKKRPNISVGDHIIVCDAGGGTVDLISYEILSMEPFVVREAVEGDGELCGGVFLDEAFIELIKTKVTPEAWANVPKNEAKKLLNDDWENGIKTGFYGQSDKFSFGLPSECRVPGTSKRGVKRKQNLVLSRDDLLTVFDPIIDQTAELVQKQIGAVLKKTDKKPKKIILVGGFGRCIYLRTRLQDIIGKGIEILQGSGNKPWSAISRGAVISGLTARNLAPGLSVGIASRISRRSYGIRYSTPFKFGVHDPKDKYWCTNEHKWKARDQMEWFLEQGTDVSIVDPVNHSFYRLLETTPKKVSETIYATSAWPVPATFNKEVDELCTITWTKKIDLKSLKRYTSPTGKVFRRLEFNVEMTCSGSSVDFAVLQDGNQVGAQNVSVIFKTEEDD
ncbi:Heat shock 70 kDa protein 12A [Colletotrichum siamense]|uniref:Heat shock 70 kDa protein 12A n=1 Tax=Colletotrichum siamense TaxID=690259 RepID=UPI00187312CA|nr:Heat shock 70 kDa protein 12A [Colletotrichum siamense]KAF5495038.1 Heat shock 70 kDa protein 12A [Colletotrichum siamense]